MIARYTGAVLGFLAFGVACLGGLAAGNPAQVVLSRAIWSLIVFCIIGLAIGTAAQAVINEFEAQTTAEMDGADKAEASLPAEEQAETIKSTSTGAEPMGT
jgi:hypothetical protein